MTEDELEIGTIVVLPDGDLGTIVGYDHPTERIREIAGTVGWLSGDTQVMVMLDSFPPRKMQWFSITELAVS